MKTYFIESRVTTIESIKITAKNKQDAIKIAKAKDDSKWEQTHAPERQLVSIS
jgi:hypothetical protein